MGLEREYHKEEEVNSLYELLTASSTKTVKAKLNAIHEVCKKLVSRKVDITVPRLVTHLTEAGLSISEQSLYNPKSGKKDNPYKLLYLAWQSFASNKLAIKVKATTESNAGVAIDDKDLLAIENPVLRYKISLMYAELKSLRRQNDLIRQVNELPVIVNSHKHALTNNNSRPTLLEYNQELIGEFIKGSSELGFDESGRLFSKRAISRNTVLSADDFRDALIEAIDG
ncbi:gamma-mobile-trio protein GmtX [Psychrobium sp. 1_MG-2023]|uniref:gamma-mobile-trio protein GmtX n=1 Tax=Psychrobium sp. 1_MG-2023 TaxID=3062624 RepID=UPI002735BB3E|nr:gamma-mobile-trio protein GmtX [Psychrobium sp. 1_MG-2023]MDP2562789.1 gamma-mobile-trio protein GmtX [Psychrobium sp. 1_MG-2023]